jgi:membrane carboxypeptidase/penicillin-binding protein PbpC
MAVDYTAIALSAEDRQFHWHEALRLRALAQTITTPMVRNRVLERAHEHARLIGEPDESS